MELAKYKACICEGSAENPGYKVFNADGKVVYASKAAEPAVKVPFLVKVSISDLNIRKGRERITAGFSLFRSVCTQSWKSGAVKAALPDGVG